VELRGEFRLEERGVLSSQWNCEGSSDWKREECLAVGGIARGVPTGRERSAQQSVELRGEFRLEEREVLGSRWNCEGSSDWKREECLAVGGIMRRHPTGKRREAERSVSVEENKSKKT